MAQPLLDTTRGYDSFFGPPSEPISIRKFLDDTSSLVFPSESNQAGWQALSEGERAAVEAECSIAELKAAVEETWGNPMLSAHLRRVHTSAVDAVHCQAGGSAPKSRKRKHLPDPETVETRPEVRALEEKMEAVSLQCWRLQHESALFVRASKHSDFNALKHVKKSGRGVLACNRSSDSASTRCSTHPDALVTLAVYNRVPWAHSQLTRASQHVVLSSQSLADFVRAIPCDSSDMPTEVIDDQDNVVGYSYDEGESRKGDEGCLLLIEDIVYGDGRPGDDYADKLVSHLEKLPEAKRPQFTKSPSSLSDTLLISLALRVNQPYWMLHQGNCEHFVVVDEIRLAHPLDPPSGYPLTVYVTPTLGDFCKGCTKVPAVFAVLGDIRLGESPCLLCAPCWRNMGPPREEGAERVMVVPLVKHRQTRDASTDG